MNGDDREAEIIEIIARTLDKNAWRHKTCELGSVHYGRRVQSLGKAERIWREIQDKVSFRTD